jgi:hypothetical protein
MASEARIGIRTDTKQAEQGIKSVRGMFADLGKDAKSSILAGVGLGAGVTAFNMLGRVASAATDFIGDSVRAAAEEETGIRRLTTAISENVAGWDGNIAAIEQVIKSRERLGFADGEQRESLAVLTSVTKDATHALEHQRTAMDLARLRGMNLASASELIGKVYAGNIGILARYGIQLARGTSATEALAEIQRRASGQAEAFADTAAGAAAALAIEFENLQEDIGKELLPIMVELATTVREDIIPAIRGLFQTLKDLEPVLTPLGELFRMAFVPGAEAVENIRGELEELRKASEASGSTTARNWMAMGAAAEEAFGGIETAGDELVEDIRALPGDLASALQEGQKDVEDSAELLADAIQDQIERPARIAYLQGELTGSQLAAGLNSTDQYVRDAAAARRNAIQAELAMYGIFTQGYNIGKAWSDGIINGISSLTQIQRLQRALWEYRWRMVGKSPPPKGPLKDVDTGGFNIGEAWVEGIRKGIGGFELPSLGMGGATSGMVPAMAGVPALPTIIVQLDGRELHDSTARWEHYAAPGGPAVLPR